MTRTPPPAPRAGSSADRDAIARCWARAPFREAAVRDRLGIASFDALDGSGRERLAGPNGPADLLALLTQLFVVGREVPAASVTDLLDPTEAAALAASGLVCPVDADPSRCWSPFEVVPIAASDRDVVIVADRTHAVDGSRLEVFPDLVFSGHNALTRQFLRLVPKSPVGSVLDLCSGSGVAAISVAPTATRVVASDLTSRCTDFARFNAWLNRDDNVDARQGDLYESVRGERFDRILAHPPYVPTLFDTAIYRDGGETGDKLVRGIVEKLPDHLEIGGTFYMLTIGMDTADGPFESRVQQWLGGAADEFDLVFALGSSKSPEEFARMLVAKVAGSTPADFERWMERFNAIGARNAVYGAIAGKRIGRSRGESQVRRVLAEDGAGPEGFEWLFRWFEWLRRSDRRRRVMAMRPTIPPATELEVFHVVEDGRFAPQRFRLRNARVPFEVTLEIDGWIVGLMQEFDGSRTVEDVFADASIGGHVPPGFAIDDMQDLVCVLCERGLVSLDWN